MRVLMERVVPQAQILDDNAEMDLEHFRVKAVENSEIEAADFLKQVESEHPEKIQKIIGELKKYLSEVEKFFNTGDSDLLDVFSKEGKILLDILYKKLQDLRRRLPDDYNHQVKKFLARWNNLGDRPQLLPEADFNKSL